MLEIRNQVRELRKIVKEYKELPFSNYPDSTARIIEEAADTIENLFEKNIELTMDLKYCNKNWILCSERYPEVEKEVEITYTRKHCTTGELLYFTARAFYEDGTVDINESDFSWENTDSFELDRKTHKYIVQKGWYEAVSFSEECGLVDEPVIAWRPLAKAYNPGNTAIAREAKN